MQKAKAIPDRSSPAAFFSSSWPAPSLFEGTQNPCTIKANFCKFEPGPSLRAASRSRRCSQRSCFRSLKRRTNRPQLPWSPVQAHLNEPQKALSIPWEAFRRTPLCLMPWLGQCTSLSGGWPRKQPGPRRKSAPEQCHLQDSKLASSQARHTARQDHVPDAPTNQLCSMATTLS